MHPPFGVVTIEALLTGLIIAIIGLIAIQAYASYKGHTGKIEKDFVSDNFWGMATSFFVIGTLVGYLAEYSGANRKACLFNYGSLSRDVAVSALTGAKA
jgi:hypothetical protein